LFFVLVIFINGIFINGIYKNGIYKNGIYINTIFINGIKAQQKLKKQINNSGIENIISVDYFSIH